MTTEIINGTPVGVVAREQERQKAKDKSHKRRERDELEVLIEKRSEESTDDRLRRYANEREAELRKVTEEREAEQAEAFHHSTGTWLRHLQRVYTNRLQEVEERLTQLEEGAV